MYSLYITPRPSLQSYTMHAGRGGVIYREYTECYSISFLFLFFFHQSSLYSIKIFAKFMFLFTTLYPFFSPNFERAKVNNIPIFREPSVYTNGHGVILVLMQGYRWGRAFASYLVKLLQCVCTASNTIVIYLWQHTGDR